MIRFLASQNFFAGYFAGYNLLALLASLHALQRESFKKTAGCLYQNKRSCFRNRKKSIAKIQNRK